MLTPKHWAVLRAALQYFQEELVPHGIEAVRPYVEPEFAAELAVTDLQTLGEFLREVRLRYTILIATEPPQLAPELMDDPLQARHAAAGLSGRVVVVLLPAET